MNDDVDTLRVRLDRIVEQARQAVPEDREHLELSIRLASQAIKAVSCAAHMERWPAVLKEEPEANAVRQGSELIALLAELRTIIRYDHRRRRRSGRGMFWSIHGSATRFGNLKLRQVAISLTAARHSHPSSVF